jgi:hypothetical protein
MVEKNGKTIQLREVLGSVNIIVDGVAVKGFRDYTASAEWAKYQYGLTDSDLKSLYTDYRATSGF